MSKVQVTSQVTRIVNPVTITYKDGAIYIEAPDIVKCCLDKIDKINKICVNGSGVINLKTPTIIYAPNTNPPALTCYVEIRNVTKFIIGRVPISTVIRKGSVRIEIKPDDAASVVVRNNGGVVDVDMAGYDLIYMGVMLYVGHYGPIDSPLSMVVDDTNTSLRIKIGKFVKEVPIKNSVIINVKRYTLTVDKCMYRLFASVALIYLFFATMFVFVMKSLVEGLEAAANATMLITILAMIVSTYFWPSLRCACCIDVYSVEICGDHGCDADIIVEYGVFARHVLR